MARFADEVETIPPRQARMEEEEEDCDWLVVHSRKVLCEQLDGLVPLGSAWDGMPLCLEVTRRLEVAEAVLGALSSTRERLPPTVAQALSALEAAIQPHSLGTGLVPTGDQAGGQAGGAAVRSDVLAHVAAVDGARDLAYCTKATAVALLGPPLLSMLLGEASPLSLVSDTADGGSSAGGGNAAAAAGGGGGGGGRKFARRGSSQLGTFGSRDRSARHQPGPDMSGVIGGTVHLLVPLGSDEAPLLVCRRRDGDGTIVHRRPFVPERLDRLCPSACAQLRGRFGARRDATETVPLAAELQTPAQRQAFWQHIQDFGPSFIGYSVSRQDVAGLIIALAHNLQQSYHAHGRIHGDVKPGNTLVTAEQVLAIDGVGVAVGEPSPIATFGWASPEQCLGRALTPATDVYPLALMATALLNGALFGEEKSYIVPVKGQGSRRVRVMVDCDVDFNSSVGPSPFAADAASNSDAAAKAGWQALLTRSLSFDPQRRPPSCGHFAEEMAAVLAAHPLQGVMELQGHPAPHARAERGLASGSWILRDQYQRPKFDVDDATDDV